MERSQRNKRVRSFEMGSAGAWKGNRVLVRCP